MTYIKENIITKIIQPAQKPWAVSKSATLFVKKHLCTGNLSPGAKYSLKGLNYSGQFQSVKFVCG